MKKLKRKLALVLAACMVMTSVLPVFAEPVFGPEEAEILPAEAEEMEFASAREASPEDLEYGKATPSNVTLLKNAAAGGLVISADGPLVSDVDYSYSDGCLTILTDRSITVKNADPQTPAADRIYIPANVAAHLVLSGVNIRTTAFDAPAVCISDDNNQTVQLSLAEGTRNLLYAEQDSAIRKRGGGCLIIDGDGCLDARSDVDFYPVIGGRGTVLAPVNIGGIRINGGHIYIGTITKRDASDPAYTGIGGGYNASASDIFINGGEITIHGFKNPVGGGYDPYGKYSGSENIVFSKEASIKADRFTDAVPVAADGSSEALFLCDELPLTEGTELFIDGTRIPGTSHDDGVSGLEQKRYIYLTPASEQEPHEVSVSERKAIHIYYDTENSEWAPSERDFQDPIRFEKKDVVLARQDYSAAKYEENHVKNYNLGAITAYASSNSAVAAVDGNGDVSVFSAGKVTITAVSKKSGCPDVSASYTLTIKEKHDIRRMKSDNGTFSLDKDFAMEGEEITITPEPVEGYEFTGYSLYSGMDQLIGEGTESFFVMPDEEVKAACSFALPSIQIIVRQDPSGHGFVSAPESARPGETVKVSSVPETGYELWAFNVTDQEGHLIFTNVFTGQFVMPDKVAGGKVYIDPTFVKKEYCISIEAVSHGTVEARDTSEAVIQTAAMGETVELKATADSDYKVASLSVLDAGGKELALTDKGGGYYEFVMPASDVSVRSAFARISHDICIEVASIDGVSGFGGVVEAFNSSSAQITSAAKGEEVILRARPESDYALSYLNSIPDITLSKTDAIMYSFAMPDEDVLIKAAFEKTTEDGTRERPWKIGTEDNPGGITAYIGGDNTLYINTGEGSPTVMKDFNTDGHPAPYIYSIHAIKEIVVSEGVPNIGDYAFYDPYGISRLTEVSLPDSLTKMGKYAFSGFSSLEKLTIPASVSVIGANCFKGDTGLHTIIFEGKPGDFTLIDDAAFAGVTAEVHVPSGWLSEDGTFDPEDYQFGGKLTYIVEGTAEKHVVNIRQPEHGIVECGSQLYEKDQTVTVTFKDSEDGFGWYFDRCFITPYVPYSVASVDGGRQISFTMPDCDVEISASYISPGTAAQPWLIGYENEEEGKHKDSITAWCDTDTEDSAKKTLTIKPRRDNAVMANFEEGDRPWELYADEIAKAVVIEESGSCLNIGEQAFEDLTSLKEADLGTKTQTVGKAAFSGCAALEEVKMSGVAHVYEEAFANCTSLILVDGQKLYSIGQRAFAGCSSFLGNAEKDGETILDLNSTNTLYREAFSGCTALETVLTSSGTCGLGTVPEKAFCGCSSLTRVTLAKSVERIEADAFRDCSSLARFQISGSCGDIAPTAFLNDASNIFVTYDFLAARTDIDRLPHINDPGGAWYYGAKQLTYIVSPTATENNNCAVKINQTKRGTVKLYRQGCAKGARNWIEIVSAGGLWQGEIAEIKVGGNVVSAGAIRLSELTYIKDIPGYERTRLFEFIMPEEVGDGKSDVEFKISFEENPSEEDFLGTEPEVPRPKQKGQPWDIAADGTSRVQARLEDGTLYIEKNAPPAFSFAMMDFSAGTAPWYSVRDEIRKVVIGEGVTSIGNYAFYSCRNLESIVLSGTIAKIGSEAFYGSGIKKLNIPASVEELAREAFNGCRSLEEVNYEGRPASIHVQAFRNAKLTCYVTDAWLSGGVTIGDLNDKGGDYQYSGTIEYVCASGEKHSITLAPSEGGTVTIPFDKAAKGTLVIFDVAPATGYSYSKMNSTGVSVPYYERSFTMPANDVTLTPVFTKNHYYIYSDGGEGVRLYTEKFYYDAGETVKILPETEPGYEITGFGVCENGGSRAVEVSSDGTFTMPAFDVRIYAETAKTKYGITVNQTDDGVAFINGVRAAEGAAISACVGDELTLGASPVPGRKLKEWQIEASGEKITTREDTYTMPACDITVMPVFDTPYSLVIGKAAGGRVTCGASYAFAGDTVKLIIRPDPGFRLDGWEKKPASLEIAGDGSFTMPESGVSLTAKFTRIENTHAIMSSTDGNGTLTIAGEAKSGEMVSFAASPLSGYRLRKISVRTASGVSVMVSGNSFTMPDSDISVKAEFEKIPHQVNLIVSGNAYGSASLISPDTAGIGDIVEFSATASADCRIGTMLVSPWADISEEGEDKYTFRMPDTDADIILEFAPVRGTETYPWLIGRKTPENVKASNGHTAGTGPTFTGLYIRGNGTEEMRNFADGEAPWAELFGNEIGNVKFVDVVNISDYALAGSYRLDEVSICEGVKNIGKGAFKGCEIGASGKIVFEGKPDHIEPDAFEGVEAVVSVGRSWLYGGLTVDDLNRADGPYQYGGRLTYEVRPGNAEIKVAVVVLSEEEGPHGSVTVRAEKTGDPNVYRADRGETVGVNCTADEGYHPNIGAKIHKEDGSEEDISMNPDKSLTLPEGNYAYAKVEVEFKPDTYAVTYDFCGRGALQKRSWAYNETIAKPSSVPLINGYEIEGWYTDPDFTKKWNFDSDRMPAGDMTLYANWVAVKYEITWKNHDGSQLKKTAAAYGEIPAYDGEVPGKSCTEPGKKYVFDGWMPAPQKVTGSAEYTATFALVDAAAKTVIFDMNGYGDLGPVPPVQTLSGDCHVTEPTKPSDSDHVFDGWYRERACTGEPWNFKTDTVFEDVTTLYAKWTRKTCEVTWKNYDGTVLGQTTVPKGTYASYTGDIPKKASTSEKEYAFAGWDPAPLLVTENVVYTAVYTETARSYIVRFDGGGKGKAPAAQSVQFGAPVKDPGSLSEAGYVFGGWYRGASCASGTEWDFSKDTMPAGPVTLTAKWTPEIYDITWRDDDGSVLRVAEVDYNTMPVYDGKEPYHAPDGAIEYVFAGWTPGLKRADKNEIYTAVYDEQERQYTVTFDTNGKGSGGFSYKTVPGSMIEKPDDPTAEGYDFAGWYKDAPCSAGKEFDFEKETMPSADLTLYAKWTVKTFRIVWKNYDGSVLKTDVDKRYGSFPEYTGPVPVRPETKAQRFTFTGWAPEIVTVTEDAEYTAQYSAADRLYTVTWLYDDGTLFDRVSMKYGKTPSHVPPSKEGYVFTGWDPKPGPVTADITYRAGFEKKPEDMVTVTFDTDGGSLVDAQVIVKGEKATRPADPAKKGYTFAGWYTDTSRTYAYEFSKPVETDTVLYAKWAQEAEKKYIVTWRMDDGALIGTTEVREGEMPYHVPVSKDGYIFTGWEPELRPATADITYRAKFEKKKQPDPPKPDPDPDPDPDPKPVSGGSVFFTGTWDRPVSGGLWQMDADGVWYYRTTRPFRNTWGYIVNPYAGEGQHRADWFWFDDRGRMLTGWQFINGKWYYLNPSMDGTLGACLIGPGKTPDGYEIDASGAWTGR